MAKRNTFSEDEIYDEKFDINQDVYKRQDWV